ncbi:MAG: hypothetical protein JWN71_2849 [Xanthobacteraceae bacterium]|nr:hypothetical protein [Xanthobacteraceae bacterium]
MRIILARAFLAISAACASTGLLFDAAHAQNRTDASDCRALQDAYRQKRTEVRAVLKANNSDDACGSVPNRQKNLTLRTEILSIYGRQKSKCGLGGEDDETADLQEDVARAKKALDMYQSHCRKDQDEAAARRRPPSTSGPADFGIELIPSGQIDCFGGCQQTAPNGGPLTPAPRNRPSTITEPSGPGGPSNPNSKVRDAR